MSRFRRLGLAATAAAAVLALAVPPSASAITIKTNNANPIYNVSYTDYPIGWTFFHMGPTGTSSQTGMNCVNIDNGMPVNSQYGWGLAEGSQGRTLFVPAFQQPHPAGGGGCWWVDQNGNGSPVTVWMAGALALALTDLVPGQNPSSPQRRYHGRLFFYESPYGMSFAPATHPGCSVKISGPQSTNLWNQIVVDDDQDQIDINASGASFAITKTAACPSTIGNTVRILQTPGSGWRLNNVVVTP